MPHEYIEYEQVQAGAEQLRECANRMEEIFNAVTGHMNNMTTEDTFQGNASNELAAEFEGVRSRFEDYVSKVRDFADAFTAAGEALRTSEEQIKKNVANI